MSEKNTGKIVRYTLDLDNPPPFTAEELEQIEKLKNMRDEDIDLSDIPEQTGLAGWSRPGLYGGPVGALRLAEMRDKLLAQEKLLLLDDRVIEFFKQTGGKAPEKMNAVLLEYVEAHRKSA
ncbi:hypothetical protein SAMN05421770_10666 [Granulicella rosea]|uniref:BrnA antitoxin of type II toxin-antitoxin system n=1 Tax=Granulicella rosea TaxID=474952 RepID=A0A239L598_9BACT|nr:hypothetical protein [Granulicella rosea]SNT24714.1 hypothetical protein SAMN05421770_10666 [Granulicella rosea]